MLPRLCIFLNLYIYIQKNGDRSCSLDEDKIMKNDNEITDKINDIRMKKIKEVPKVSRNLNILSKLNTI